MFETVLIATDGSTSAERAVRAALDLARRFDATVHALYVVDSSDVAGTPDEIRAEFEQALRDAGERALSVVSEAATVDPEDGDVVTVIREGDPVGEICTYADERDVDVVATGTRGRHGEHGFMLGSVAEGVVRRADPPVLTVRQLDDEAVEA